MPVDKIPLDEARRFLPGSPAAYCNSLTSASAVPDSQNGTTSTVLHRDRMPDTWQVPLCSDTDPASSSGDCRRGFRSSSHHLATGFADRQVGEEPFVVNSLVAIVLASQFAGTVADLVGDQAFEPVGGSRPASPTHRPAAGPGPRISGCPVGVSRARRLRPQTDPKCGMVSCGASGRSSAVFPW